LGSTFGKRHPVLTEQVLKCMRRALRGSTSYTYQTGIATYTTFCKIHRLRPIPAQPMILASFAAHMHLTYNLSPSTITTYLYGVKAFHTQLGIHCDLTTGVLQQVLRGIRRSLYGVGGERHKPRKKLPITLKILHNLKKHVFAKGRWPKQDATMIWAAMCSATNGLLRSGEFCVKGRKWKNNPKLLIVAALNTADTNTYKLHLRDTKTDTFGAGTTVHLFRDNTSTCPVAALEEHLKHKTTSSAGDPLFAWKGTGKPLTYTELVRVLRSLLQEIGEQPDRYGGHSFRRGGATSLARNGTPDHIIQILGRWNSFCYRAYIDQDIDCIRQLVIRSSARAQSFSAHAARGPSYDPHA